jgi:sulfatase maturation enzyme AslB (radical SAM superfamily)
VADYRGDDLVRNILRLVDEHKPLQVSLVGGEPLIRHRELSRVLPELSRRDIYSMVVTSAVIPIPKEWKSISKVTVAVSVDGNPEDHDVRRKPATYDRILRNIEDRKVNVHWTVVRSNVERPGYIERYLEFWNARPEVDTIWVSIYTPQLGEESPERLTESNRRALAEIIGDARGRYPKLLMHRGLMEAFLNPPAGPADCQFAKCSVNYTADLKTRVEPCVFGGSPNCAECGCAISLGMHWLGDMKLAGPVRGRHVINASMGVGRMVNRLTRHEFDFRRIEDEPKRPIDLVQIQ